MKLDSKAAYLAAGATVLAAIIASVVPLVFSVDTNKPSSTITGDNNNVVQGAKGDVTIDQRVNDLGTIDRKAAASMKQSLVSGCETMLDYFVTEKNFDVDSVDTLIGEPWVNKQEFISYFGAEEQRAVMEIVNEFNPAYIEYIPGVYWFSERGDVFRDQQTAATGGQLGGDQYATMDAMYREKMDAVKPKLVDVTTRMCAKFRGLEYVEG